MNAMILKSAKSPLVYKEVAIPRISSQRVLLKVNACGVCRTYLHILDGELTQLKLPLIPGHEIIGMVVETSNEVTRLKTGDLVGIPWLG